jgi:hypothetical protein
LTVESKTALIDIEFQANTVNRQRIRNPLGSLKLKTKFLTVKIILRSSLMMELTVVANPVKRVMNRIQSERISESSLAEISVTVTSESETKVSAVSLTVQS